MEIHLLTDNYNYVTSLRALFLSALLSQIPSIYTFTPKIGAKFRTFMNCMLEWCYVDIHHVFCAFRETRPLKFIHQSIRNTKLS
jgi:hypothetical protein